MGGGGEGGGGGIHACMVVLISNTTFIHRAGITYKSTKFPKYSHSMFTSPYKLIANGIEVKLVKFILV